jgi:hypothetical protein
MNTARNLADPDYEPTDEELRQLSRDAFGGLQEVEARTSAERRARIQRLQQEALALQRARRAGRG